MGPSVSGPKGFGACIRVRTQGGCWGLGRHLDPRGLGPCSLSRWLGLGFDAGPIRKGS